ncbi:uncharacterized protein LOC142636989 [Castanea sativa]|uniref:uncharacterized protein LOC142636989 n=1 Tax=Castanea sativa TaxID=21020 RepID=UPI003F649A09
MVIGETKVSGERAKRISDRINLDEAIFAYSIGLLRGLWVLWDFDQFEIAKLASTEQEVHLIVTSTAKPPWLLSAIYASPRYAERRLLWENLESVATLHSMPWVIAGDFNEVLMGEDKFDGCSVNISGALFVLHLENTHSDHCPIKLCFEKQGGLQFPKPFRFQAMWFSDPSFPRVVREAWNNTPSLQQALSTFSSKVSNWNKNPFGSLFHRKRRIIAKLKGIQESMSLRPNAFLVDLESKLRLDYAEVAKIEEEF